LVKITNLTLYFSLLPQRIDYYATERETEMLIVELGYKKTLLISPLSSTGQALYRRERHVRNLIISETAEICQQVLVKFERAVRVINDRTIYSNID
jgi:hypothetical protein